MAPAALGHLHGYIYISPAAFPTAGGGVGQSRSLEGVQRNVHGSTRQHRSEASIAGRPCE